MCIERINIGPQYIAKDCRVRCVLHRRRMQIPIHAQTVIIATENAEARLYHDKPQSVEE